jgi:tetratricopeptide (TPR) repeat protein
MPTAHSRRWLLAVVIGSWIAAADGRAQTSPRAAMLEASGWDALEAAHYEQAASIFREAIGGDQDNPRLHLGAALAAFALRRDTDARAALDRLLDLEPRSRMGRELLGRVLYRTGDLDGAIRTFDALVADGATETSITTTLERWKREAELHERMHVAVGNGVTVAFEGPDDAKLAERALASMARATSRIWDTLSYYPVRPIAIVLYTNEQFRDITRAPDWAAGSFDGIVRVPMRGALEKPEEFDRVLTHEYVHALIHELAPSDVPAWLDEGLAAALESEAPPAAGAAPAVPLRSLTRSFGRLSGDEARRAYDASAHAVRRLIDTAGGFAIANLLRDLGAGEPFERAFEHRIGRSFQDFEADLRP